MKLLTTYQQHPVDKFKHCFSERINLFPRFMYQFLIVFCNILNMDTNQNNIRIAIKTQTGLNVLNINTIIYCKGEGRYTFIYLNNNKHIVVAKLLKDIELVLPIDSFYRIHKSYLINLDYVKELNILKEKTITLNNDTKLKLACRRQPMFFKKLLNKVTML